MAVRGQTRQKLVECAIQLLRTEGLSAVTTVRVTRGAGIAQSGFYKHFKSIDGLLEAAAERISTYSVKVISTRRGRVSAGLASDGVVRISEIRTAYEDMLAFFVGDPVLTELLLRCRFERSVIGERVRDLLETTRNELLDDLWDWARRHRGASPEVYPRVALAAELIQGQMLAVVEALVFERFKDSGAAADTLARATVSVLESVVRQTPS